MDQNIKNEIVASIQEFRLPEYSEIPDTGLYLEQTAQYISKYMEPLEDITLTGSMISNYVKKRLVANPVRKQYSREQIAYLFFIAAAKSVLSMEDISLLIDLQKKTYPSQIAYDYFRCEFINVILYIFGVKDSIDNIGMEDSDEKYMLRNLIISVAHKIYLNKYLSRLRENR